MHWIVRIVGFPLRLIVITVTFIFFLALVLVGMPPDEAFASDQIAYAWRFLIGKQNWM